MASGFASFEGYGEFLNAENKELTEEVKRLENNVGELTESIREENERRVIMEQHLVSVKAQLQQTTQLVRAKSKEVEDEEHNTDLNKRQIGKLNEMIRLHVKNSTEMEERNAELQNHLFRRKDEIDELKAGVSMNQTEFDNWVIVLKQKEADIDTIEKYSQADNSHIRELRMTLDRLQKEMSKRRGELEREVTNTQSLQIELDKTAEDFQNIQKSRHELIKRFEDLINALKERDEMISNNRESASRQREEMSKLNKTISDQRTIFDQQQAHNKQLEARISQIDSGLQRLLTENQNWQQIVQADTDETAVQRGILTKARVDLSQTEAQIHELQEQMNNKNKQKEAQEAKLQSKTKELEDVKDETKSKEQLSRRMEQMLASEENRHELANRELKELKDEIFKQSQILFKSAQDKATAIAEINGAETSLKNMGLKIKKLDAESLRQSEIIYRADFQIQLMERKIPRAMGVRSDEEKQQLNAKIAKLTDEMDAQNRQWNTLANQVKRLDEELHEVTNQIEGKKVTKKGIEDKIADIKLANDNAIRSLTKSKTEKEELAVRHDVMTLEMKRLNDTLHQRHSEVVTLKNRQQQLELTIRERQQKIKMQNEMLRAELRRMEDDRRQLVHEVNDRRIKIERLRLKYENILGLRGGTQEAGIGEESAESHALAIVKAAQKRQELEAKGDELDAAIKAKQRELEQLRAALHGLEESNQEYRESFRAAGSSSQEMEERKAAEEELKQTQERLRGRRAELSEVQQLAAYQQKMASEAEVEADMLMREAQEHILRRTQLEKEVEAQHPKIERAQKQLQTLIQQHREKHGVATTAAAGEGEDAAAEETDIEREFQLDELKETNQIILSSLVQIGNQDPRIKPVLDGLLQEAQINPRGMALSAAKQTTQGAAATGAVKPVTTRSKAPSTQSSNKAPSTSTSGSGAGTSSFAITNGNQKTPQSPSTNSGTGTRKATPPPSSPSTGSLKKDKSTPRKATPPPGSPSGSSVKSSGSTGSKKK